MMNSRTMFRLVPCCAAALAAVSSAAGAQDASPPPAPPAAAEAWFTGPVAASSANTLPRGHFLFEPYLYDVRYRAGDTIGSTVYILYGATDRLTVGAIPTFASSRSKGSRHPRRYGVGDLSLTAQYRLNAAAPGDLVPTTSLVVQRVVPVGRFDRLGTDLDGGIGGGASATLVGAYFNRVDLLGQGRPFRTRLNLTYTVANRANVHGASVYGTPDGFSGRVRAGDVALSDFAVEYSVSRRWALAADVIYRRAAGSPVGSRDRERPRRIVGCRASRA